MIMGGGEHDTMVGSMDDNGRISGIMFVKVHNESPPILEAQLRPHSAL
jgi:hypothetical protein